MFIPIGDAPSPRCSPVVTWLLIAANVVVFLVFSLPLEARAVDLGDPRVRDYLDTVIPEDVPRPVRVAQPTEYDLFIFEHGYRPARPTPADLLASLFLHAGLLHLAGNMLFLWIYGKNVEHRIGHVGFGVVYLACGVLATLSHGLIAAGSEIPTIGASGAISGVLGLYFIWFPKNTVRVLFLFPPFFFDVIVLPARLVLGAYIVLDNLFPFLLTGGGQGAGVAYGAHIGGFFAGMAIAWALQRRLRAAPTGEAFEDEAAPEVAPGDAREALIAMVAEGRIAAAANVYFSLPRTVTRGLLPPLAAIEMARGLRGLGRPDLAVTVLLRLIDETRRGTSGLAEAHVAVGRVLLDDLGRPADAYQHLVEAVRLGASPEVERAAMDGLARIQGMHRFRVR